MSSVLLQDMNAYIALINSTNTAAILTKLFSGDAMNLRRKCLMIYQIILWCLSILKLHADSLGYNGKQPEYIEVHRNPK